MPNNRGVKSGPGVVGRAMLAVAGLASVAAMARDEPITPLVFEVRAVVAEQRADAGAPGAPAMPAGHGKKYGILSVQLVDSENDLVTPVDEDALTTLLMRELDAHGFRQVSPGQSPEILLTVHYGRGWLANPYKNTSQTHLGMTNITTNQGAISPKQILSQEVVDFTPLAADVRFTGREAMAQKASYEKLYVRVTAWEFPREPTPRAHMLWKTTIFTDDPDHQDLNTLLPSMLDAGVHYFGRETEPQGVEISRPIAEGHVEVGTLRVVDAPAPALESRTVPPAAPAAVVAEPLRKFAVPAGMATETLRAFAEQSDERIIYPVEQVLTVKTHGVTGDFTSRAALEAMLQGTGLVVMQDEKTGTFIIRRASR